MRATRTVALSGLLGLGFSGAVMLGAGSASAATPPPAAPPICAPAAAPSATGPLAPVANVVNPVPLLGPLLAPVVGVVAPPLPVCGPDGSPAKAPVAPAVAGPPSAMPAPGTPLPAPAAVPAAGPSSAAAAPAAAPAALAAAPSLPSYGRVPRYTSGDLTSVPAGGPGYTVNVAPMPGAAPGFVPLADPSTVAVAGLLPATRTVSEANQAIALPTSAASSRVPMQAVLAALILALTTAALVRTWVLRHTNI